MVRQPDVLLCTGISIFLIVSVGNCIGVVQLGEVKCFLSVDYSDVYDKAHETCWMREKERKDKERKEKEKDGEKPPPPPPPYPHNATIEEFVFDDKCRQQCIYEVAGIVKKDSMLPDKKDTETLFSKGKVTDERYKVIISAWNDCIDLSDKIGNDKKFTNCLFATHHDHCFTHKMVEAIKNLEVPC